MPVLSLTIDRLALSLTVAAEHEHRARAIGARSAALLRQLAGQRLLEEGVKLDDRRVEAVWVPPLGLDLAAITDEEAATRIARAAYAALLLSLAP
jgi:hypothetical protein